MALAYPRIRDVWDREEAKIFGTAMIYGRVYSCCLFLSTTGGGAARALRCPGSRGRNAGSGMGYEPAEVMGTPPAPWPRSPEDILELGSRIDLLGRRPGLPGMAMIARFFEKSKRGRIKSWGSKRKRRRCRCSGSTSVKGVWMRRCSRRGASSRGGRSATARRSGVHCWSGLGHTTRRNSHRRPNHRHGRALR